MSQPSIRAPLHRESGPGWAHRLGAALFGLWLLFVVAIGQPNYAANVYEATVSVHAAYGALFAVYACWLLLRRRLPSPLPFDAAITLTVVALVVSATASVDRGVSLEAVLLSAAPLAVLYAVHDAPFLSSKRLITVLLGVASVMALLGLIGAARSYLDWLELSRAVEGRSVLAPATMPRSGGLIHPNILAMLLNLAWPFAVLKLLQARGSFARLSGALVLLLLLAGLFFTLSRGGWLAAIAAGVCFGALYFFRGGGGGLPFRLPWRRVAVAVFMASALALAGAALAWESRPGWLFRDTLSLRQEAAAVAVDIFADHPVTGAGPNTYGLLYEPYGGQYPVDNVHPHNAYLSVLVDAGVIGALFYAVAGVAVAAWLLRCYLSCGGGDSGPARKRPGRVLNIGEESVGKDGRARLAACVAALVTLPVHGLFDSPQLWNPVLLMAVVVLAIALREAPQPLPDTRRWAVAPRLVAAGLLPLVLAGWLIYDLPHARYDRAVELAAAGRLAEAAETTPGGGLQAYHLQAGILQGQLFEADGDVARLERAASSFEAAVEADPHSAIALANLAQVRLSHGDVDGAAEAASQAHRLARHDASIAALAGVALEAAGREDDAIDAYGRAMALDPRLAQSAFWQTTARRLEMRAAVIDASGLTSCQVGYVAVLYGGFPADMEPLLGQCRDVVRLLPDAAGARAVLALILYATGAETEALREARAAVAASPENDTARRVLGVVLSVTGDVQAVRHELLPLAHKGDDDARVLLAATYGGGTIGRRDVSPVLSILARLEPMPPPVRRLLEASRAAAASRGGGRNYLAEQNYFQFSHMRQAPSVMLLPGEWQQLVSPYELRFIEALAGE